VQVDRLPDFIGQWLPAKGFYVMKKRVGGTGRRVDGAGFLVGFSRLLRLRAQLSQLETKANGLALQGSLDHICHGQIEAESCKGCLIPSLCRTGLRRECARNQAIARILAMCLPCWQYFMYFCYKGGH